MDRTLFLHVGMPKCATTTIQDFLRQNAGALAAAGLRYVFHPEDRTVGQGNGATLAAAMYRGEVDLACRILDHFLEGPGDAIISSEILLGLARSAETPRLIARAAERGYRVKVICYLRRQDLWIESDFKQHVKGDGLTNPTGDAPWLDNIQALVEFRSETKTLNYTWTLMHWAEFVGRENVLVEPLRPGQPADAALRRFLAHVGAPQLSEAALAAPDGNVSPPAGLIEPARILKRAWIARGFGLLSTTRRLDHFFDTAPGRIAVPERRFLLPLRQRRRLVHRFQQVNGTLGELFLGGADPFGDTLVEDPASELPLGEEAAEIVALYLMPRRRAWRGSDLGLRVARRVRRLSGRNRV